MTDIDLRVLGRVDYLATYRAMQAFTADRTENTPDSIWLCEHPPVFTQGLAGRPSHVHAVGDIPLVHTDRGGQVTYHGPGQVVAYPLIDLRRAGYYVKELVYRIEDAVIRTLGTYGITGHRVGGAPGIYVRLSDPRAHASLARYGRQSPAQTVQPDFAGLGKIAALGIKVSRHCSYHGVALNVAMDLSPFGRIDPCGYQGLRTVDLSTIGVEADWNAVAVTFGRKLQGSLAR